MVEESAAGPERGHPTALTIAGFDPGTGAGCTADLLTFARFGLFATSALTALTVQSSRGVRRVQLVDPMLLHETLEELEADLPAAGLKIGMLGGEGQARVVTSFVQRVRARRQLLVVVDPVLVSSSGAPLLQGSGLEILREELLPFVDAVTPNAPEAAMLSGQACRNHEEAERCAAMLAARYTNLVPVVTGGHFDPPSDLLWQEGAATWLRGERLTSRATHGTGCAFSSALLAARLLGKSWVDAAAAAKSFVSEAVRTAEERGGGYGPMNLLGAPPSADSSGSADGR